jgi:hypothetical protein
MDRADTSIQAFLPPSTDKIHMLVRHESKLRETHPTVITS